MKNEIILIALFTTAFCVRFRQDDVLTYPLKAKTNYALSLLALRQNITDSSVNLKISKKLVKNIKT
jgi:hypothetical protein